MVRESPSNGLSLGSPQLEDLAGRVPVNGLKYDQLGQPGELGIQH